MQKQILIREAKDYFNITLGLMLYTFAFTVFLLPYEIVTGGIAGIGAVVFYATKFPVQYTFFIINAVLIVAALKILGWRFLMKTIYATFMLTFLLDVAQRVVIQPDGTKQDARYNIGDQNARRCQLRSVDENLAEQTQSTPDQKCLQIFQVHHLLSLQIETAWQMAGMDSPCHVETGDMSAPVAQKSRLPSLRAWSCRRRYPHSTDAPQPQPEPPAWTSCRAAS